MLNQETILLLVLVSIWGVLLIRLCWVEAVVGLGVSIAVIIVIAGIVYEISILWHWRTSPLLHLSGCSLSIWTIPVYHIVDAQLFHW